MLMYKVEHSCGQQQMLLLAIGNHVMMLLSCRLTPYLQSVFKEKTSQILQQFPKTHAIFPFHYNQAWKSFMTTYGYFQMSVSVTWDRLRTSEAGYAPVQRSVVDSGSVSVVLVLYDDFQLPGRSCFDVNPSVDKQSWHHLSWWLCWGG